MWSNIKNSILANILFLGLAAFASYSAARMALEAIEAKREQNDLSAQIFALEQKKKILQERIMELETPESIDREAKRKLNLKRPGEEAVVIVPPEKEKETSQEKKESLWESFLNRFR